MLTEISVSEFDQWHSAITGRPWHLDPQRYYGNHHISMIHNMHSKKPITPEQADIYYREQPKQPADWRAMKAAMTGVSGVTRKENVCHNK
jgi:hypothetical protein